jgi:hypothetical protein
MLSQGAFLFNSSGGAGSGVYTVDVNFSNGSKAQFLAPGDTIIDRVGIQFSVTTWATFPSDFSSNGTVTVAPLGADVSPTDSLAVGDASVATPNQVDLSAQIQTNGSIINATLIEGRTYKYRCSAGWAISADANKAVVGDNFIDNAGKVFEITALSGQPGAFSSPFEAVEVDQIGDGPNVGQAFLYRGTPNFSFYQGQLLNPLAEETTRNRDEYVTDVNLPHPSGAGNQEFTGLIDTPSTYAGQSGQVVTVNASETALEFTTPAAGGGGGGGAGAGAIASGEALVIDSASGIITNDYTLVLVTESGAASVILQGDFVNNKVVYVKDAFTGTSDRTVNTITIIPPSGQTIDGDATLELVNSNQSFALIHSSGVWYIF